MKIKGYQAFILSLLALFGAYFGGWRLWRWVSLNSFEIREIKPGKVNLLAVTPGKGYRVIVANRIAQLGEVEESKDGRNGFGGRDSTQAINLKRIPIRELLGTVGANEADAGKFIERMNDLLPPDEPVSPFVWKAEDISKALAGDPELKKKLELDLQTTLDGKPVNEFSVTRILNGILIDTPVPITLGSGNSAHTITARVRQKFQTRLASAVEKEINGKFTPPSPKDLLAIYITQSQMDNRRKSPEKVADNLQARLSPSRIAELRAKPERIAGSASVLVNESHFVGATKRTYKTNTGKTLTDLTIRVNDEGKKRLWKYSAERPGFQLMLIVDGVAIAAPRISTDLAEDSVTITQMPDPAIAANAMDRLNGLAARK